VPVCAHDCFADLIPSYGCTGLEDLACQCLNFEAIGTAVTPCVVAACTHQEVEAIFPAAQMGELSMPAAKGKYGLTRPRRLQLLLRRQPGSDHNSLGQSIPPTAQSLNSRASGFSAE
jgi:hypothetical protein